MVIDKNVLFDYLLENTQDIITLIDLNLNYVYISRSFLKLYGFSHSSLVINKNIKGILQTEIFDVIVKRIEQVISLREPMTFAIKVPFLSGDIVFKTTFIPVIEVGEITGILSISRDITNEEDLKLKLIEKVCQLNTLLDNEKCLKTQKEIFMATLTHDLKNPVQAQLMSLKLLKDGALTKSEVDEIYDNLLESSTYMNEMLCSLLNTYKYNNGLIELEKAKININELMTKCINEINTLAKSNNISIIYNISDKNLKIYADIKQLRRVIGNILNNSVHYGYKNTELHINIFVKNNNIVVEIENTSDVIDEELKQHIFEKYVTTGKYSGTGLGLYFSKKIIEAHKGKIYLYTKGHKNKFVFELPISTDIEKTTITW